MSSIGLRINDAQKATIINMASIVSQSLITIDNDAVGITTRHWSNDVDFPNWSNNVIRYKYGLKSNMIANFAYRNGDFISLFVV